jgi:hypothetical protein
VLAFRCHYKQGDGAITYNAPGGYHDDCVIALALTNSGRFEHKWAGEVRVFGVRRVEPGLRVGPGSIR